MRQQIGIAIVVTLIWTGCDPALPVEVKTALEALPERIEFNQQVKPLLADRCFVCHGPDEGTREAGLRLDLAEQAYAELPESPGRRAIVPGSWRRSELVARILSTDPEYKMPAEESHLLLTPEDKAILLKWIKQGAPYEPHWAFIKPHKPAVPDGLGADEVIDHFIMQKCSAIGLTPNQTADKETLLRRLSLDLTGLPPTLDELDQFLADNSPQAYEKQVDRLLASPHYGEKMAAEWLDVARYADSHGYTVDRLRDMSPWRDWVIRAFNQNLSYRDFITWQVAGDLLPEPTRDQLVATGFNRNHQHNMEGGIVEEEFRVEYVADRTNTTAQAFMALTAGCARCHDHKFDPFTQKNYFELFAFFNQVKEAGQISWDNAMPVPTFLLTDSAQEDILNFLERKAMVQELALQAVTEKEKLSFATWLAQGGLQRDLRLTPSAWPGVLAYYPLTDGSLRNKIKPFAAARMFREGQTPENPQFATDESEGGLSLNGDTWLDLKPIGGFSRSDPFSISLWVKIPAGLTKGVLFHQGSMHLTYNFRGLHLALEDGRLQLLMAHTAPYNAIIQYTQENIPRDEWLHVTVTYDGSSKAQGLQLYLNGEKKDLLVDQDLLYKDILFDNPGSQPGLQFGAWERGKGLEGGKMRDIYVFNRALSSLEVSSLADKQTLLQWKNINPAALADMERELVQEYYFSAWSAPLARARDTLKLERKVWHQKVEKVPEMMIMQDMPVKRPTFLLDRGQYDAPKEEVQADVPENLLSFPADYPRNRLGLAQWLTHPDHPLTARVAVNRLWQNIFGRGLVSTAEDFGNQGQWPSHPELLDWLALHFQEQNWDVKRLIKLMVMSKTYCQSSVASAEQREKDPENIWLARGPAQRLTAEMLRDQALKASGLLHERIGGPSVFPYQPEGLWSINGGTYTQDSGQQLYRRAMYTVWKRSVPHPSQATFDVGIRTNCTVTRQKTNTPLQALVLLNDPTFNDAARALGQGMDQQPEIKTAINAAFRQLTGRHPLPQELDLLTDLHRQEETKFKQNPERAKGWLKQTTKSVKSTDQARQAAYVVVASTIINSDAAITKR